MTVSAQRESPRPLLTLGAGEFRVEKSGVRASFHVTD